MITVWVYEKKKWSPAFVAINRSTASQVKRALEVVGYTASQGKRVTIRRDKRVKGLYGITTDIGFKKAYWGKATDKNMAIAVGTGLERILDKYVYPIHAIGPRGEYYSRVLDLLEEVPYASPREIYRRKAGYYTPVGT